jgi:HEAT repeats
MTRSLLTICFLFPLVLVAPPSSAGEKGFSTARAAMRKGLASSNVRDRANAVWELDGFDSAQAARTLVRVVLSRDDRAPVINGAIKLLASLKSEEAIDALVAESTSGPPLRRARVLEVLGRLGGHRVDGTLLTAAYDENDLIRTSAVLGLEGLGTGRTSLALGDALQAKAWPVRSAATGVIRRRGDPDLVPALIERLRPGVEDGRLAADAARALVGLTDHRFGISYDAWRRWFVEVKGGELPPEPENPSTGPVKARVEFSDLKSVARRVVFVLAVNESMRGEIAEGGERRIPSKVKIEGGPVAEEWLKADTKLELAQLWLARTISSLDPEVCFDVITYGAGAGAVFGELLPATPRNRQKAIGRISSLSPSGRANVYAGLRAVFELLGKDPLGPENLEGGPETVFFISDGTSETGEIIDGTAAVDEVGRLNRYRQIQFLAVGAGEFDSRVLAEVAGLGPGGALIAIP